MKKELLTKIESEWRNYAVEHYKESRVVAYQLCRDVTTASAVILSFSIAALQIGINIKITTFEKTFLSMGWILLALSILTGFAFVLSVNQWLNSVSELWSRRADEVYRIITGKKTSGDATRMDVPTFGYLWLASIQMVFFLSGFVSVILFGVSLLD